MARKKKKILSFPPKIITLQFIFPLSSSFNDLFKKKKTPNKKPELLISFSYAVWPEEIKYLSLKGCMGCEKKLQ